MNRTAECPHTKTYRGPDNSGNMRMLMLCTLGRFYDARADQVRKLTRGKHACMLCEWWHREREGHEREEA